MEQGSIDYGADLSPNDIIKKKHNWKSEQGIFVANDPTKYLQTHTVSTVTDFMHIFPLRTTLRINHRISISTVILLITDSFLSFFQSGWTQFGNFIEISPFQHQNLNENWKWR